MIKMTGNVPDFTNPRALEDQVIIENNNISYQYYPAGNINTGTPSIKGRRFYIPLNFWFSMNPALALPLVALQYQLVNITVEFRPLSQLYQVWNINNGVAEYVSPLYYNQQLVNHPPISISTFLANPATGVDIQAFIECELYFLR